MKLNEELKMVSKDAKPDCGLQETWLVKNLHYYICEFEDYPSLEVKISSKKLEENL